MHKQKYRWNCRRQYMNVPTTNIYCYFSTIITTRTIFSNYRKETAIDEWWFQTNHEQCSKHHLWSQQSLLGLQVIKNICLIYQCYIKQPTAMQSGALHWEEWGGDRSSRKRQWVTTLIRDKGNVSRELGCSCKIQHKQHHFKCHWSDWHSMSACFYYKISSLFHTRNYCK